MRSSGFINKATLAGISEQYKMGEMLYVASDVKVQVHIGQMISVMHYW